MTRYIDADLLIDKLEELQFNAPVMTPVMKIYNVIELVEDQPTADVEEVRHGRWLPQIVAGVKAWDCSECKTIGSPQWKRCPICEAKMDGGKENER